MFMYVDHSSRSFTLVSDSNIAHLPAKRPSATGRESPPAEPDIAQARVHPQRRKVTPTAGDISRSLGLHTAEPARLVTDDVR
jgi:hypothetical protein